MMTKDKFTSLGQDVRAFKATNPDALRELAVQIIWIMAGTLLSLHYVSWIFGQLILGVGFWRSFAILHACGHNAFFRNRKLNDLSGFLIAPLCFIPYFPWKYIHQDHHVWTGWKDLDPTTRGLMKQPARWQQSLLNFCWKSWLPLISIHYIVTLFFDLNHSSFKTFNRRKILTLLSMVWVILFHLGLVMISGSLWLTLFGLSIFIYLNMGDLSLLTQHVHLPLDKTNGESVDPKNLWEQDQYSHTMLLPDFATRWIAMGFNHHSLHHLFPSLPYYKTHLVHFKGTHTHGWKEWILKSKSMKATELIFHEPMINSIGKHGMATPLISTVSSLPD